METNEIKILLEKGLPGSLVAVEDFTGTGDHFQVFVAHDPFKGKGMIHQHKEIYSVLGDLVGGPIHAIKIKILNKEEWGIYFPEIESES